MGMDKWLGEVYEQLSAPFGEDALTVDKSRGESVVLVGVKGGYVTERLNDVFGMCGVQWTLEYSNYTISDDGKSANVNVAIQYRLPDEISKGYGGPRFAYDSDGNLRPIDESEKWSRPVYAVGSSMIIRGRVADAKKGAVTMGLSKAASYLGVGMDAYKGMISFEDGAFVRTGEEVKEQNMSMIALVNALKVADMSALQTLRSDMSIDSAVIDAIHVEIFKEMEGSGYSNLFKDNWLLVIGRDAGFKDTTVQEIREVSRMLVTLQLGSVDKEEFPKMLEAWKRDMSWAEFVDYWGKQEGNGTVVEDE